MIEAKRMLENALKVITKGEAYMKIEEALSRVSQKGCLSVAVAIKANTVKERGGEKIDISSLIPFANTFVALRENGFIVKDGGHLEYSKLKEENTSEVCGEIVTFGEGEGLYVLYFVYITSVIIGDKVRTNQG